MDNNPSSFIAGCPATSEEHSSAACVIPVTTPPAEELVIPQFVGPDIPYRPSLQAVSVALADPAFLPLLPRRPGPGFWASVGWCLLMEVLVAIAVAIAGRMAGGLRQAVSERLFYLVSSSVAFCLIAWLLVGQRYGRRAVRIISLRRVRPAHLLLVTLLAPPLFVVGAEVSNGAAQALGMQERQRPSHERPPAAVTADPAKGTSFFDAWGEQYRELARQPWLLVFLAGCLLPALGEEVIFRGFLGRGLVARFGPYLGVALSSALFGIMHVHPVQACFAAVLGVVLHAVYLATRSLWAPVVLHTLNNTLAFALMKLSLSSPYDPTGQYEQAHLSPVLVLSALLAVIVLAVVLYRTRVRWARPDGRPWEPGYVTAETPPAALEARPCSAALADGLWFGPVLAYVVFGATCVYTQALAHEKYEARLAHDKGCGHLERGDLDQAAAAFSQALRLDPECELAHYNRGVVRSRQHDFDAAIRDFDSVIRKDPAFAEAYQMRGLAYWETAKYERAAADLARAARHDPTDGEAPRLLAWLKATCSDQRVRDGQQALVWAQKACQFSQWKDPRALAALAAAHAACGQFPDAVRWQTKALELATGEEQAFYRQLRGLYQSGQPYRENS